MKRWLLSLLLAAFAGHSAPTLAQVPGYPSRPLRIIVPFSVGTPPDILARLVGEKMSSGLGQAVIVDNRPGATGTVALAELDKQPADGHTLYVMAQPISVAPSLYPSRKLDFGRSLQAVGQMTWSMQVLVVPADSSIQSAAELLAAIKSRPGQLSFASGGNGTPAHLAGELFKQRTGTQAVHVPYNNFPQGITDLVAGRIQYMFLTGSAALPLVKAGKLRALAVTGPARIVSLKDTPSMVEAGFPDFVVQGWEGLVVKAGTPNAIVERLNGELRKALAVPQVRDRLAELTLDIESGSPQQFSALIGTEVERWGRLVKAGGIKDE